ncbi:MAG: hypothetical protein N3E36_02140 [Sulfolobales archaeon]|nr:hypothetical protein [Sulfolobales archaeon]
MEHCLNTVTKLLIKRGHVIYKRSEVKEAFSTEALTCSLVYFIIGNSSIVAVTKFHQSNTLRTHLSIKMNGAVLYERACKLENAGFTTAINEDRLVKDTSINNAVKTLRDAINSTECKGG